MSTSFSTEIEELIRSAFAEDHAEDDITTRACIPEGTIAQAKIVLKQWACVAGLQFLPEIFQIYDSRVVCREVLEDGSCYENGTILAVIEGPARSLLSVERVALNFLQHLSGVATLTRKCVEKVAGTQCQILDTRKTIIGLRHLQKYAVKMGGGTNHRMHLGDRILIKNNHIKMVGFTECLRRTKGMPFSLAYVEVEIDKPEMLEVAISAGVNAVLLDNMSVEQVRECVVLGKTVGKNRVYLEASGGMTLDTIASYAKTGVDGISIGALTHSAPAVDISMRIV